MDKPKTCRDCRASVSLGDKCPYCGGLAVDGLKPLPKRYGRVNKTEGTTAGEENPWGSNATRAREGD